MTEPDLEQEIRRLGERDPKPTAHETVIERYCDAWNRGDLDAIFGLFAEDARYEGVTTHLTGRAAIKTMYERTFAQRRSENLLAKPVRLNDGAWWVEIYDGTDRIAVKAFSIIDGLIVLQRMEWCR